MKKVPQIIFHLASFVVVLILGNLFDEAFLQAGLNAKRLLGNMPMSLLSQFLIEHHHLPAHLTLLPWLCLVGAPLLTLNAAKNYWDLHSFTLRYLAFLSCELLLFLVWVFAFASPFIPHYSVMDMEPPDATETVVRLIFWIGLVVVILAACRRAHQIRCERNS